MAEKIIRVDESLEEALRKIQQETKRKISKQYGIDVGLSSNAASKIAAAKLNKQKKPFDFKIRKTGKNKGFLDLI